MLAMALTERIGPSGVRAVHLPEPRTADGVVIDVGFAGVSYPDLLQTRGGYQVVTPLPVVLGSEGAGVVRTAPEGSLFDCGQRVAFVAPAGPAGPCGRGTTTGSPRRGRGLGTGDGTTRLGVPD